MAKNTLPTNFKDDILNASMNGKRRYNLIQNSDGTVSLEDASTYDQVGSEYGAGQVNAVNKAVNESADAGKIIDDVDDISAVTKEGYIAGALALKEVNNSLGGFQFKTVDDEKKVSTDGGSTWENFSNGAVLLWENSAPTSVFNAQTIEIDLSNYDSIIISFISQPALGWTSKYRFFILKNESQGCNVPMSSDTTTEIGNVWGRIVSVSNKGVKIGYALEGASNPQNACMPIEIYGIKSVIKQK